MNILVVEDEKRIRDLVKKYLENEGFNVIEAIDGKDAIDKFDYDNISLVVLDVMMPKMDGWSVLREIKKSGNTPVIMLTARADADDRVFGLELGADDYLAKPFNIKELILRVNNILQRKTGYKKNQELILEDMKIDDNAHRVFIGESEIELSPKEYDLLYYFAKNKEMALSRESILDKIWGYDYYGDTRTVDTLIKRLRKKISKSKNEISTVRGLGYRFEVKK